MPLDFHSRTSDCHSALRRDFIRFFMAEKIAADAQWRNVTSSDGYGRIIRRLAHLRVLEEHPVGPREYVPESREVRIAVDIAYELPRGSTNFEMT